jgi:hypothetical protein
MEPMAIQAVSMILECFGSSNRDGRTQTSVTRRSFRPVNSWRWMRDAATFQADPHLFPFGEFNSPIGFEDIWAFERKWARSERDAWRSWKTDVPFSDTPSFPAAAGQTERRAHCAAAAECSLRSARDAIGAHNSPVMGKFGLFSTAAPRISVFAGCRQRSNTPSAPQQRSGRCFRANRRGAKQPHRGGATEREGRSVVGPDRDRDLYRLRS